MLSLERSNDHTGLVLHGYALSQTESRYVYLMLYHLTLICKVFVCLENSQSARYQLEVPIFFVIIVSIFSSKIWWTFFDQLFLHERYQRYLSSLCSFMNDVCHLFVFQMSKICVHPLHHWTSDSHMKTNAYCYICSSPNIDSVIAWYMHIFKECVLSSLLLNV